MLDKSIIKLLMTDLYNINYFSIHRKKINFCLFGFISIFVLNPLLDSLSRLVYDRNGCEESDPLPIDGISNDF